MEELRRQLEDAGVSGCPLCGQDAWDFDNAREVFLIDAGGESKRTGERYLPTGSDREEVLGKATKNNRLVQLTCSNCRYTALFAS